MWKRRGTSGPSGGSGVGVIRSEARIGEAFLWDGDVIADAAPLYADGTIAWDKAVSWHHEPGTFRPIAREEGEGLHHVVTDHLGTPRELYDEAGQRAWSRSHRLWGETRGRWRGPEPANEGAVSLAAVRMERASATPTDPDADNLCPIGFPGQWADAESGLAYNRFRYYETEAAQYVSADPIRLHGGIRPQDYAENPSRWFDPLGLARICPEPDPSKAKVEITIPMFGCKSHVSIDRKHGFGRRFTVTSAAAHDGAQLPNVLDPANTASDVWADTAHRSKASEAYLAKQGRRSRIHFRRQPGLDLTPAQRKANRAGSKLRSAVETVFAGQKNRFGLFVRTIGLARARTKIGLANLAYNLNRFLWIETRRMAV